MQKFIQMRELFFGASYKTDGYWDCADDSDQELTTLVYLFLGVENKESASSIYYLSWCIDWA